MALARAGVERAGHLRARTLGLGPRAGEQGGRRRILAAHRGARAGIGEQGAEIGDRLRAVLGVNHQRAFDRARELLRGARAQRREALRRRIGRALVLRRKALRGRGRAVADEAAEHHRADRVDVGPRPLVAAALVLLERRVAVGHHRGQRLAVMAERLARRAEIDQHRRAVFADEDVVGLDVAVEQAGFVHRLDAVEQRIEEFAHLALLERRCAGRDLREGLTLLILHHEIGGAVRLEVVERGHDVRMPHGEQHARLLAEAREAPIVILARRFADRLHRHAVALAHGERARQVFLDRDRALGDLLLRAIGDAEAAGAEHLLQNIVVQPRALGKGAAMFRGTSGRRARHDLS